MGECPFDVGRVLSVDQDLVNDPYPVWAELRATCPVFREPLFNVVVVTKYDDIVDVARRPHDFSSVLAAYGPNAEPRGDVPHLLSAAARDVGTSAARPSGYVEEMLSTYQPEIQDQLQHVDPPLHTHHRRVVSRWFTPDVLAAREDEIRSIARHLVERIATGGEVEMLDAFAGPFPATVVADTIGIPEEHRELFLDWKEEMIGNPDAEGSRTASERYTKIRALFREFIAERRMSPRHDLITSLVEAQTPLGEPLDETAVLSILMLFLGGGQETTAKAFTTGLRLLAQRPELQTELATDPSRIPAFVDEVLRIDPPVRGIFRLARRETTVGGVPVPEGSLLQLMWASGNRDESVFVRADEFVPDRTFGDSNLERPFLTFGHGVHLCPGAPLARLQLHVGFEELLTAFSSFSLSERNDYRYFKSQVLRGLSGLWLHLEPRKVTVS